MSFQELVLLWSLHCLSEATQLGESPETAFAGLVREGRGEARVSTLTAEKKRKLARMKHAAVQTATRPQHSCDG